MIRCMPTRALVSTSWVAALALALLALATPARADDDPIAGTWTVTGGDTDGAYSGSADVAKDSGTTYRVTLHYTYTTDQASEATFTGTWDGKALKGQRKLVTGISGAVSGSQAKATPETFELSADGTALAGTFGTTSETLTRPTPSTTTASSGPVKLVIFHTNDIHGQLLPLEGTSGKKTSGFAALVDKLRSERAAAVASGASVLTLDAGDIFEGTPEGDIPHGRLSMALFGLAGYDAMAIGNHEFDQGVGVVQDLCERAPFPVLSANLKETSTGARPKWVQASIRKTVQGLKVCVIGILTSDLKNVTTTAGSAGVDVDLEADAVKREMAANPDAQVFILLTHVGVQGDQDLGQSLGSKVAAIVGGHSHTAIQHPSRVGSDGPIVVQAGAHGSWLGRLELSLDPKTGKLLDASGSLLPVSPSDGEAADVKAALDAGDAPIEAKMDSQIGTLAKPLPRSGAGSTPLGDLCTDLVRAGAHADFAFLNKSGIRASLPKGPVRFRDVYAVDPFANAISVEKMTGQDVIDLIEESLDPDRIVVGVPSLELSGAVVTYDSGASAGHRVQKVTLPDGHAIDPSAEYTVATNVFLAEGGDHHSVFTRHSHTELSSSLQDLLAQAFHGHALAVPAFQQRLVGH